MNPTLKPCEKFFDDRRGAAAAGLIMVTVLALANLPFIWGWLLTPPDFVFSGTAFNNADITSYIAKMREGLEGAWIYTNRYTTDPHRPALLFMFYVALGHVARIIHLPLILTYHLARTGFGLLLLLSLDRLIRVLGFTGRMRLTALVFIAFATGLGMVMSLSRMDTNPAEIWWGESYVFHSILLYPHFTAVSLMIVLSITDLYLYGAGRGGWSLLPRMGLWAVVLAWGHPRLMLNVVAVGGAAAAIGWFQGFWKPWRWGAVLAVLLVCWAIPSAMIINSYRGDPAWERWAATDTPSPGMFQFFATYGLLWVFAAFGLARAARAKAPWATLVICWAVIGALLPYLPITGARRLIQGLDIPLGILAAYYASEALYPDLRERFSARAAVAGTAFVMLAVSASTFWFLYDGIKPLMFVRYPWYYGSGRVEAMRWLHENTDREDVVLCSQESGMPIPAYAGNRVYLGHWAESLRREEKEALLKDYFNGKLSPERTEELYRDSRASYLFLSSAEARIGPYNPAMNDTRWEPVYNRAGVLIYRFSGGAR